MKALLLMVNCWLVDPGELGVNSKFMVQEPPPCALPPGARVRLFVQVELFRTLNAALDEVEE